MKRTVFIFVTSALLFLTSCDSDSKPSQVDITLLEQMADYQMYGLNELKERIELLENMPEIQGFDGYQWGGDVGRVWRYKFTMNNPDIPASVNVSLEIYDNPENAKEKFNLEIKSRKKKGKIVKVSEDIDVRLCHSVMYRNADEFYASNSQRHLYTYIRLGNIVINFYEHLSVPRDIGVLTSDSLKLICQVLA